VAGGRRGKKGSHIEAKGIIIALASDSSSSCVSRSDTLAKR